MTNTAILKQNLEDHQTKKINYLTEKLEMKNRHFESYTERARVVIRENILKNEEFEREKIRQYIKVEKERLGEYILHRDMTKTKELWIDGFVMKDIKKRLQVVKTKKEHREKFKKMLKKRKTGRITSDEIIAGELLSSKDNQQSKPFCLAATIFIEIN